MKNLFKKAVSLTVALSAVAALSVSAFADYTVEQDDDEVKVTVGATLDSVQVNTDADAGNAYATAGNGQYAVAVVPANFTGSEQNADELIYYVNQADQTAIVTILNNMLLKGALTVGTDYEVRIGTDVTNVGLTTIDFKVVEDAATGKLTLDYGDVDDDGVIGPIDVSLVQQMYLEIVSNFVNADNVVLPNQIGDVDGDGIVGPIDVSLVQQRYLEIVTQFYKGETPLTSFEYTYTITD